jgi:hypothetical protein
VAGYYAPDDGGGGLFSYNATEVGPGNACTVFVDASNNHWDRQLIGSTLSVLECGAKADNGITDNSSIFQVGISALLARFGGGTLFLPASYTPGNPGTPNCYGIKSQVALPPFIAYATTASNRIVTITFPGNYAFPVGSSIVVSGVAPTGYNTTPSAVVTASTAGGTTSTVSYANSATATVTTYGQVASSGGGTIYYPSAFTGGTAMITLAGNHLFPVGSSISVAGVTPTAYDTTSAVVTASTSSTVLYASSAAGAQTIAGLVTSFPYTTTAATGIVTISFNANYAFPVGSLITVASMVPMGYNTMTPAIVTASTAGATSTVSYANNGTGTVTTLGTVTAAGGGTVYTATAVTGGTAMITFAGNYLVPTTGSPVNVSGVTPLGFNVANQAISVPTAGVPTSTISYSNSTPGPQTIAGQVTFVAATGKPWDEGNPFRIMADGPVQTCVLFTGNGTGPSGVGFAFAQPNIGGTTSRAQNAGVEIAGFTLIGPQSWTNQACGLGLDNVTAPSVHDMWFQGFVGYGNASNPVGGCAIEIYGYTAGGSFGAHIFHNRFGIPQFNSIMDGYGNDYIVYDINNVLRLNENRYALWLNGPYNSSGGVNDIKFTENRCEDYLIGCVRIQGNQDSFVPGSTAGTANFSSVSNQYFAYAGLQTEIGAISAVGTSPNVVTLRTQLTSSSANTWLYSGTALAGLTLSMEDYLGTWHAYYITTAGGTMNRQVTLTPSAPVFTSVANSGAAQAATGTSLTLAPGASTTPSYYNNMASVMACPFASSCTIALTSGLCTGDSGGVIGYGGTSLVAAVAGFYPTGSTTGCTPAVPVVTSFPATGATGNGTTATITFTGSYVYPMGSYIIVSGVSPTGYNEANVLVTASSAGTVSYSNPTNTAGSGGTVSSSGYTTSVTSGGSGTAQITFLGNYLFPVGSYITVSGVAPAGYNATNVVVTASTAGGTTSTVSYASTGTGSQSVAGMVNYVPLLYTVGTPFVPMVVSGAAQTVTTNAAATAVTSIQLAAAYSPNPNSNFYNNAILTISSGPCQYHSGTITTYTVQTVMGITSYTATVSIPLANPVTPVTYCMPGTAPTYTIDTQYALGYSDALSGAAQGTSSTTVTLQSGSSSVSGFYNNSVLTWTTGSCAGDYATISSYSGGAPGIATIPPTVPTACTAANGDNYTISYVPTDLPYAGAIGHAFFHAQTDTGHSTADYFERTLMVTASGSNTGCALLLPALSCNGPNAGMDFRIVDPETEVSRGLSAMYADGSYYMPSMLLSGTPTSSGQVPGHGVFGSLILTDPSFPASAAPLMDMCINNTGHTSNAGDVVSFPVNGGGVGQSACVDPATFSATTTGQYVCRIVTAPGVAVTQSFAPGQPMTLAMPGSQVAVNVDTQTAWYPPATFYGIAQSATTTTAVLQPGISSTTTTYYNGGAFTWLNGNCAGASGPITGYNGSTLTVTTGALSGCSGGETSGFQYSIASIPGSKNPVHAGSLLLAEAPPLGHNGVAVAIDPTDPAVTPAMIWQACAVAVGSATTGTAYPIGSAVRAISNH